MLAAPLVQRVAVAIASNTIVLIPPSMLGLQLPPTRPTAIGLTINPFLSCKVGQPHCASLAKVHPLGMWQRERHINWATSFP